MDSESDLDDPIPGDGDGEDAESGEYDYEDGDYDISYPDSFMHDQSGIENLAREMLKKYDWSSSDDGITKEQLVVDLAEEMHDKSTAKPYEVRKDDWKSVMFVLKRSCPDDNDKTYDSWISAITSYLQSVIDDPNTSGDMKAEYQRLKIHIADMAERAKTAITPEYKIPSRMTTGRRQLLMSLIWLYTRRGQVIDLDKVPYSTLDLVKSGTKYCMTEEEVTEEQENSSVHEFIDEMHSPGKGFISGLDSALTKPLRAPARRQAPKHCDSGHWSGQIRKFTKSDKDMFDELWGTRLGELHNYIRAKEKQLSHKEEELKAAEERGNDHSTVQSLEDTIKKLHGRINWCHEYLEVGNRVSKSDSWKNAFAEFQRVFGLWAATERKFWGGIIVATDAEHLDAQQRIMKLGIDTVRLSGNKKAIYNAESAKDLVNIASSLGSVGTEHNNVDRLKKNIEQERNIRDNTELSDAEREEARRNIDTFQKEIDIARDKRMQSLQLSTAAGVNFANNATYLDKTFTPEQRKKLASDAHTFAENAGDFAKLTQMNEEIARDQDKLEEIQKELDNPAIDRDPKRKAELEAEQTRIGDVLYDASEKLADETNEIIQKVHPCEATAEKGSCQIGQKCLDPKGNIYDEDSCGDLVKKHDQRGCSWTGHACEVGGSNKFATTEATSTGLKNLYTKGDIRGDVGKRSAHGFNNNPYGSSQFGGSQFGGFGGYGYQQGMYSPRRRKSRLRSRNRNSSLTTTRRSRDKRRVK